MEEIGQKPIKVYLVELHIPYDVGNIDGIYSSEERAIARCKELNRKEHPALKNRWSYVEYVLDVGET